MSIQPVVGQFIIFSNVLFSLSLVVHAAPNRSLSIPIAIASSPNQVIASIECVVSVGQPVPISALAFSSDAQMLAVGGYKEVLIWDLSGAKLAKRLGVGQIVNFVHAITFLKEDRLLAVGEGTPHGAGAVRIFNVETGQQTHIFEEPNDVVYALSLSPDGRFLAAGGADKKVCIWSLLDNKLVTMINEHSDWVMSVVFSPDGKSLATGGYDKTALLWEVSDSGGCSSVVRMKQQSTIYGLAFGPDSKLLAVAVGGPADRAVRIRSKDNPRQAPAVYIGGAMPLDIVWAAKSNKIYVSCSDNTVKVFDAAKRTSVATFGPSREDGNWVYTIGLSPDETKLASGSADGTIKLWDATENKLLATLLQLSAGTDDWLIITEKGYFAASSSSAVQWKTANLTTGPSELTSQLQNLNAVREVLAAKKIESPSLK